MSIGIGMAETAVEVLCEANVPESRRTLDTSLRWYG